jgi:signal transduction histidine kinase
MVKGNSNCFKQVVLFFTGDALRHSTKVKVHINLIRTKEEASVIELQVQDNGPGMSEAELDVCGSFYLMKVCSYHF